jgi:histone acetyltransferase
MAAAATSASSCSTTTTITSIDVWTREKKLEKISQYTACQVEACKCNGFKLATATAAAAASPSTEVEYPISETCKFCTHLLADHTKNYQHQSDSQLNRLLKTVLDVETLFSLICKEEDADSKHI